MKSIFFPALLMLFSLCAESEVTSSELFKTINERLGYMEDVALFKARNHLPIEDIEREKIVIEKAKASAHEQGLDPEHIEDFFKAQISVAKAIQFRYRADLLSQPSVREPKDLQKQIRPHLLKLGDQIIQQLVMYIKDYNSFKSMQLADFDAAINVKYVTISDKQVLFRALQKIKFLPAN